MNTKLHRTWAEVSLSALEQNVAIARERIGEACRLMAVVKADAYGHGAVPVARHFSELGADAFGVASLDEAMTLREAGIHRPILILGYTPPDCAPVLMEHKLTQTVYDAGMARAFSRAAQGSSQRLKIHVKADTGMSRLGLVWDAARTAEEIREIYRLPGLEPEGLFTHLACSECVDDPFTNEQLARFERLRAGLAAEGVEFPICHCANSGAVINYQGAHLDMVRAGLLLYGIAPGPCERPLRPAMRLCSVVSQVKEVSAGATVSYNRTFTAPASMRLAVIAAGYADGYPRILSNRARVRIGQAFAPIVGNICMDMFVVDVTHLPEVQAGDTVTLFGVPELPAGELAELAGTISYEILCSVGKRVPREYA